ncbi:MAG: hypothetical protein GY761_00830 [Hyphomicrobiales bacterium]|nr:hypothetical protein [Hyphomicrobiales bacterium]
MAKSILPRYQTIIPQQPSLIDQLTNTSIPTYPNQPTMNAYEPSLRERIGNWIYDQASKHKLPAHQYRTNTQNAIDFVPGIGDLVGFDDAGADWEAGNKKMAVAGGILSAIGLIPGAGDAVAKGGKTLSRKIKKEAAKGIKAFHGSPHDFDKFSMDKIGTGEGAQAYGHGLYFAEAEDTAKSYRDALRGNVDALEKSFIDKGLSKDEAKLLAKYRFKGRSFDETFGFVNRPAPVIDGNTSIQDYRDALKKRMPQLREAWDNTKLDDLGSMYEVNIDANPEDFLDWDKPISDDIMNQFNSQRYRGADGERNATGAELLGELAEGKSSLASDKLQQAGIPGIKYKDAGSRSNYTVNTFYKGEPYSNPLSFPTLDNAKKWAADQESKGFTAAIDEGTSNYVVFDENLISIVKKYGIAGAIGLGLISQTDGEALASGQYQVQ